MAGADETLTWLDTYEDVRDAFAHPALLQAS